MSWRTAWMRRVMGVLNGSAWSESHRSRLEPNARMTNLTNKAIVRSRVSKFLLQTTSQVEINSVLFYQRSHTCVRHSGSETVFYIGDRKWFGSVLRPRSSSAYGSHCQ